MYVNKQTKCLQIVHRYTTFHNNVKNEVRILNSCILSSLIKIFVSVHLCFNGQIGETSEKYSAHLNFKNYLFMLSLRYLEDGGKMVL